MKHFYRFKFVDRVSGDACDIEVSEDEFDEAVQTARSKFHCKLTEEGTMSDSGNIACDMYMMYSDGSWHKLSESEIMQNNSITSSEPKTYILDKPCVIAFCDSQDDEYGLHCIIGFTDLIASDIGKVENSMVIMRVHCPSDIMEKVHSLEFVTKTLTVRGNGWLNGSALFIVNEKQLLSFAVTMYDTKYTMVMSSISEIASQSDEIELNNVSGDWKVNMKPYIVLAEQVIEDLCYLGDIFT